MALVSSLFTAISGMRNHQTLLDVISNNIANVNTVGFKAGRVQFRDLLSQSIGGGFGSSFANNTGGVNPIQIGTGVSVAAVDTIQTQGTLQATGNATDLAITGDGFFITKQGNQTLYTRAGSFRFDSAGRLVDPNGGLVQGWSAAAPPGDPLGRIVVDSSNPTKIGNIQINAGTSMKAQETRNVAMVGNLDSGADHSKNYQTGQVGTTTISVSDYSFDGAGVYVPTVRTYTVGTKDINFTVYDSLGNSHSMTMTLTNLSDTQIPLAPPDATDPAVLAAGATIQANPGVSTRYENNTWSWSVSVDASDTSVAVAPDNMTYTDPVTGSLVRSSHSGLVHFNTDGSLDYVTYVDANTDSTGAAPDIAANPNRAALSTNAFGAWDISADEDRNTIIGFEGATVAAGDVAADSTRGGAAFDNPKTEFQTTLAGNPLENFQLSKLPIVLVYQSMNTLPAVTPPAGTTAGSYIDINNTPIGASTGAKTFSFFDDGSGSTGGAADSMVVGNKPVALYVQKFDIDWGGVSTITAADFDWQNQNDSSIAQNLAAGGLHSESAPDPLEAGGGIAFGDGDRDWSIGLGGPQPKVSRSAFGDRNGFTADASGSYQIINGVTYYIPNFSTVGLKSQDGFAQGILSGISVDQNGKIIGSFSNNQSNELAQVAVANFQNAGGLSKVGSTTFGESTNSGTAIIGTANTNGRGSVVGGVVEQSNVDLSQELTNMIVAQRGFEANARLITTSDRILDTLINLGR